MAAVLHHLPTLLLKIGDHLYISIISLLLGTLIAVFIGILLSENEVLSDIVIGICSVLQTVPSLALLAIMIPFFGIGKLPAVVALTIYSLLPIIRNTLIGMNSVDKNLLDAAKGMGLTRFQIIKQVQFPLAIPVIMSGIRLAAVYVISWTTIASYIGAGGLGDYIFSGLNTFSFDLVFMGTIPVTILALITDNVMATIEKKVAPRTCSNESGGK